MSSPHRLPTINHKNQAQAVVLFFCGPTRPKFNPLREALQWQGLEAWVPPLSLCRACPRVAAASRQWLSSNHGPSQVAAVRSRRWYTPPGNGPRPSAMTQTECWCSLTWPPHSTASREGPCSQPYASTSLDWHLGPTRAIVTIPICWSVTRKSPVSEESSRVTRWGPPSSHSPSVHCRSHSRC